MPMTNYLENALLNHTLRATAYTAPTAVYVALYTTAPDDTGAGTEVSGGGYTRVQGSFSAPTAGTTANQVTNGTDITFPQATASWGTVTHVAILDASTLGNMMYYGALSASKAVATGDTFKFLAGNLTITLD